MDQLTIRRVKNAVFDIFSRVSGYNNKEKIFFAYLTTSENGDICEELTPTSVKAYKGAYLLKNDKQEIKAHFKRGELHSLAGPAWIETYNGSKLKKAWAKEGLIFALEIDGDKLVLNEQKNCLVEDNDGKKFTEIISSFENRPKLKVAPN